MGYVIRPTEDMGPASIEIRSSGDVWLATGDPVMATSMVDDPEGTVQLLMLTAEQVNRLAAAMAQYNAILMEGSPERYEETRPDLAWIENREAEQHARTQRARALRDQARQLQAEADAIENGVTS